VPVQERDSARRMPAWQAEHSPTRTNSWCSARRARRGC